MRVCVCVWSSRSRWRRGPIPAHKRVKVKPSREGGKKGRKGLRAEEDKKGGVKKQRKGSFERAVSVGSRS